MPGIWSYWASVWSRAFADTRQFLALYKLPATLGTPLLAPLILWALFGVRSVTDVMKICASVLIAYGFVFLVTLVWHFFAAPSRLASEQAATIAGLRQKEKAAIDQTAHKQRETRITFHILIEEGENIKALIRMNQKAPELTAITEQLSDWIKHTERALIASDLHTDASIFVHCGEILSAEEIQTYIPSYIQTQTWKHYDLARITVYLAQLQEIVKRRGL